VGTRCADHVTPLYPQKLALTSPTGGGRSVGIVRVRTKATEYTSNRSPSDPTIREHQISHNNIFEHLRVQARETKKIIEVTSMKKLNIIRGTTANIRL